MWPSCGDALLLFWMGDVRAFRARRRPCGIQSDVQYFIQLHTSSQAHRRRSRWNMMATRHIIGCYLRSPSISQLNYVHELLGSLSLSLFSFEMAHEIVEIIKSLSVVGKYLSCANENINISNEKLWQKEHINILYMFDKRLICDDKNEKCAPKCCIFFFVLHK